MRNAVAWSIAVFVLLAICGTACSRGEKSKELSALDNAYNSGILTKGEYEVKKAALETEAAALAALDQALDAGILTKNEYQVRKARLVAKAGALAALEKALKAGILTKDEYAAKKAALLTSDAQVLPPAAPENRSPAPAVTASSAPPRIATPAPRDTEPARDAKTTAASTAPAPSGAQGHSYRMKSIQVIDKSGFEHPMPSASMLIPTDWQSQGATEWNIKDNCNTIRTTLQASGPDGRAFEIFPEYNWSWADDPTFLQRDFAQKAQMGAHACDVMPPMGAADDLRRNLARIRPNAQIAGIEPMPKLMEAAQQQARQTEQMGTQYGLQQRVRPDIVRARLKYSLNGQPVEEWLIVKTVVTGTLGPSFNVARGAMTQAFSYSCTATAVAERAPQGQLDSSEKFFELLISTIRVNPEWQRRINANAQAIQQIELKGVRDRSAIVSKNAEDIRNIQRQGYENRQRSEDHVFGQYSEATRGVETYRNPSTGETVELSNQYGHAWVNNRGEYLLSDQEGFNPNVTLKEEWKPLEHVKP